MKTYIFVMETNWRQTLQILPLQLHLIRENDQWLSFPVILVKVNLGICLRRKKLIQLWKQFDEGGIT